MAIYKTTFRGFGWTGQTSNPNNFEHRLFATSDNKLVFIHDSDGDGFAGAVTVVDGTTDPVPTILAGSAITGTDFQQQGVPNQYNEQTIQLTDTRYVRIADKTQPPSPSFTSIGTEIQIIDVNLTTGASSIAATYDVTSQFDPIRMTGHFDVKSFARGTGYTDGTQILEVDAAAYVTRAQVSATISGGEVQSVDPIIVDGGNYTDTFNPGDLIGAGGTGAELSSPNFGTNRTDASRAHKMVFRISDTLFGFFFVNNGTNYNSQRNGTLNIMVFEDLGASIGVKMAKTELYDVTAPANNGGDVRSNIAEYSVDFLGSTNRTFVAAFERIIFGGGGNDGFAIAAKFNATYTAIETTGTAALVTSDTFASRTKLKRVDDTHALLVFEPGIGTFDPLSAIILEVNPTTCAITVGTELYPMGPSDTNYRDDNDESAILVISPTRALYVYGIDWPGGDQNASTVTINTEPFDNTQDLRTNDRFVDNADNLTTAWAGATTGTIVCAINTGRTHRYNGATWDLMTTNQNTREYLGLYVQELILNVDTNTVTLGKAETLVNEQLPRWGLADGATPPYVAGDLVKTGTHCDSAAENCQAVLLPNGRIVIAAHLDNRYDENAPFLNITDYTTGQANLDDGMGYWVQYFDPDAMP